MAAPTISSVTPAYGTTLGGTVLTIAGTGLASPTEVKVGATVVVPTTATATAITLPAPAHAAGAVDVKVTTTGGSATKADGYLYVLVPTIASVTPSPGPTRGGNMVVIAGSGFKVPAAPPDGYCGGAAPRTVKVTFDAVEAPWAEAASAALVYATVPEWRGSLPTTWPLAQDVRLANLKADEVTEETGENVTKADGYAIARPALASECYLQRVCRQLLKLLKRHVVDNVALSLGRDYDDSTADWERERAAAPGLRLEGPNLDLNRFYSVNQEPDEADPLDAARWFRRRPPVTVDLDFALRAFAVTIEHLHGLGQALLLLFRDVVRLRVDRDGADPAQGYVEYEIEVSWAGFPAFDVAPNVSDLYFFDAHLLIRGVHLDDDSATIVRRGWIITANDGEPSVATGGTT
jgi:Arc/MetJ family transcription regulator